MFKKMFSGLVAVAIAVTAMCSVGITASAAKGELYLDNYEVRTLEGNTTITLNSSDCENGGFKWYIWKLNSDTVLDAQRTDTSSDDGWDGAKVSIYEYKNKTTAGKQLESFSGKYKTDAQVKMTKGTYFVQVTPKKDSEVTKFKFAYKESAPAQVTVKSLKVYIPMKKGTKFNLSTVVDNPDADITYTSSNKKVATVSGIGNVSFKAAGKVTITVKAANKSYKMYFSVY